MCACGLHMNHKGDRIFYYPNGKKAYGGECATKASMDFRAAAADEAAYQGGG